MAYWQSRPADEFEGQDATGDTGWYPLPGRTHDSGEPWTLSEEIHLWKNEDTTEPITPEQFCVLRHRESKTIVAILVGEPEVDLYGDWRFIAEMSEQLALLNEVFTWEEHRDDREAVDNVA